MAGKSTKGKAEKEEKISVGELENLAQILNRVMAKPMRSSSQIAVCEAGEYFARVSSMEMVRKDGKYYINYLFEIIGRAETDEDGKWYCEKDNYKPMKRGYSLDREDNVRYLMEEYREFGVKKTNGEPCVLGGDILYSEGIPKGTICVAVVKPSKFGFFIGELRKPQLTLTEINELVGEPDENKE